MSGSKRPLYLSYAGPLLLGTPLLNKGSAFSQQERLTFNLEGLLPETVENIEEQVARAYKQYKACVGDVEKHIFLRDIQDTNETLFYRLVRQHLQEIMPIIYTPTVGHACQYFSQIYRKARGLFVSYPNRHRLDDMLQNATTRKVKVIVITDGERILGLGDQGIGGMGIPIGKLSLYTACGGISPAYTLPVVLDAGTNNQSLLSDPMYMGWRHPRISGEEYQELVDLFIKAVKRRWPNVLLQFEDFAQKNATPLLKRYRNKICCFNDDIQGTAAVALGTLLAATHSIKKSLVDCQLVFVGAGSAGCGIAEQIIAWMCTQGLSDQQARQRVWMIDRYGLVMQDQADLLPFQRALAKRYDELWDGSTHASPHAPSLIEVVQHIKPTILIGVSGQPSLFTQEVVEQMHQNCPHPIIFPLSNPTSRAEAHPHDVLRWTQGAAIVATGSPFEPLTMDGQTFEVAQCNNSYIFPGLGLGTIVSRSQSVSDGMLMAASEQLVQLSPRYQNGSGPLLPPLSSLAQVSKKIALSVALQAIKEELAPQQSERVIRRMIDAQFWEATYRTYRRIPTPF